MNARTLAYRIMRLATLWLTVVVGTGSLEAQVSPYVELEQRATKALSADDVAAYVNGDGMGFALAAELNGYPGPRHVLELADSLELTPVQRSVMQRIFDTMRTEAARLGAGLVSRERTLDSLFASRAITPASLQALTLEIAGLQGRLRNTHLAAHLETMRVLAPEQVHRYQQLRGYGGGAHQGHRDR